MSSHGDFDWQALRRMTDDFELLLNEVSEMSVPLFERLALAILAQLYAAGSTCLNSLSRRTAR